ncbi:MAG: hypothetical protein KIH64_009395 [Mycobacterium sp.]|nr:hypothetical protein [Mycobacterium sp.]
MGSVRRDDIHQHLAERRSRLAESRALSPIKAVLQRFKEIDGANQGVLVSVQLFTVVIPLMILGFSYFEGFADNASPGTIWIRELGLSGATSDTVRDAFGDTAALRSLWTVLGVAAFLVWGIPMAIMVASIFAKAWRREQFSAKQRLLRGSLWFALYLMMLVLRERTAFGAEYHGVTQLLLFVVALVPVWAFWSLTPLILVRDGGHGLKYLALAGLAGVVIDGIIVPAIGRIIFPGVIDAWTSFGPIGVAMAIMTWCAVLGTAWVITACVGAVLWERTAPTDTVIGAQTAETAGA